MFTVCNCPDIHDYFEKSAEDVILRCFLLNTDKDLSFGEPFEYHGKYYSPCGKRPADNLIIVREFQPVYKDMNYRRNITCPCCGHEDHDSWEHPGGDGASDEEECDICGSKFNWTREVEVTYSMEIIERKEIKPIGG